MRNATRLFSVAIVVAWLSSALWADQIIMKNGDRFSGGIIKKDAKSIIMKAEYYGTMSVPWDQVASISTEQPIHIELTGGQTLKAVLSSEQNRTRLRGEGVDREVSLGEIAVLRNDDEQTTHLRLLHPGFTEVWAGAINLGFAGTQGNAETRTLTVGLNAARATNNDKTSIYVNAIRASALVGSVDATTAQAIRGGWNYNRNVGTRMFVNVFNDYEYDRFQNLDLRFVAGGGTGLIVWKSERGRLDLPAGVAYNRENFAAFGDDPAFSRDSAEAYFGDDFNFKLNGATSFYQNMRIFTNLTNTGEYRMNGDIGATTKLTRWLAWTIALSNRFLSNPVVGRKRNDFLYTTGFGITFAR